MKRLLIVYQSEELGATLAHGLAARIW